MLLRLPMSPDRSNPSTMNRSPIPPCLVTSYPLIELVVDNQRNDERGHPEQLPVDGDIAELQPERIALAAEQVNLTNQATEREAAGILRQQVPGDRHDLWIDVVDRLTHHVDVDAAGQLDPERRRDQAGRLH